MQERPWIAYVLVAALALFAGISRTAAADKDTPDHGSSAVMVDGDLTLSGTHSFLAAVAGTVAVPEGEFGDVAIAAGTVQVTGGDIKRLAVAGGTVAFNGGHFGDVFAVSGDLKINTPISGDLHASSGTVVFTRDVTIGGDADVSGGDVTLGGSIVHDLTVRGAQISLAGTIGGDVHLVGEDIVIAPGTRIGGDLVYTAPEELKLPPDIVVGGKVKRREIMQAPEPAHHVFGALMPVGFTGLLLCGLVIALVWPSLLAHAAEAMTRAFPASFLTGAIAACALPVAMIVLALTLVGIPLAFLLLAAAALIFGFGLVAVCQWAGGRIRTRFDIEPPENTLARLGWGLAGFAAFVIVGTVPLLGALAQTVALVAGGGAVLRVLFLRWPGRA